MKACNASGKSSYQQPLVVHVLYHPKDSSAAKPYVDATLKALTKDIRYPFSRTLNLPVFIWDEITEDMFDSVHLGEKTIVLAVTSRRTQGCDEWCKFIETKRSHVEVLPLALDKDGLNLEGALAGVNAIRLNERAKLNGANSVDISLIQILHAIIRRAFLAKSRKKLRIFLSHAKADAAGEHWALDIKRVIDTDTTLGAFFDCTDIQPGTDFAKEIKSAVRESSLILLGSDQYSSRHWCQREILAARDLGCPMIAIDCRESYEDRIFPFVNNMPRLHVPHSGNETKRTKASVEVVKVILIETLRIYYQRRRLANLRESGAIPRISNISTCPPDAYVIGTQKRRPVFVYPDPCVFPEEYEWYDRMSTMVLTPFWNPKDIGILDRLKIGISISDPADDELQTRGLRIDVLVELAQILARQFVLRGATLIYGGDLRKNDKHGFTEYLLEEASALYRYYGAMIKKVENHLAWPLSTKCVELCDWKGHFRNVLKQVKYSIPNCDPTKKNRNPCRFLDPKDPKSRATWAHCLSEMRTKSIKRSDLRICAGGRTGGYKGKMPGVLEEILIAEEQKKPLLLLGGFGGVVGGVVNLMLNKKREEWLNFEWQCRNVDQYEGTLEVLRKDGVEVDYEMIADRIANINIKELAKRVCLSSREYVHLMQTPFVDDAVIKVIKAAKGVAK